MKSLLPALLAAATLASAPPVSAQTPTQTPAPTAPATPAQSSARAAITQSNGANLNISPKRITFDRNHRAGAIYIFNQGNAAGSFDISLVDRVMLPDGQIVPMTDAAKNPQAQAVADKVRSAQEVLQISPRRVTLAPGQGQTVRLRVVGQGVDAGPLELRSHLTISALPPRDSGVTAEEAAAGPAQSGQLSFRINALLSLSIPAIVRVGDIDVRAALENPRVSLEKLNGPNGPAMPVLEIDLVRQGANSLFGNLDVRVAGRPKDEPIGIAHGVGVYTEIDRRTVRVPLAHAPAAGEHLEVTFTDDDTSPGKLLAKAAL